MTATTVTLTCRRCGHTGPLDGFVKSKRGRYGRDRLCKPCVAARVRKWVRDNPERARAASDQWAKKNPERRKAIANRYARKNYRPHPRTPFTQEERRARRQQQDLNRYDRERQVRIDRAKQWGIDNPERSRALFRLASRRRRQRLAVGRFGSLPAEVLAAKVAYWGARCWICRGSWDQVDHVKPVAKGGAHLLCNLRPICGPCNRRKSARWPLSAVMALAERIRHDRDTGRGLPI